MSGETMTPTITVTIPAFNNENVIAETIQSVLDQTFEDFELVIVNDGSTDRTEDVIKSFNDKRIHYYSQENQGASDATNQAILKGQGKYIALLAGDDVCYTDRLEKEHSYLERTGAKAVFSWVDFINDNNDIIIGDHFAKDWFNYSNKSRPEMLRHFFFNSNFLCTTTAMISRQILIDSGLFRVTSAQIPDFTMWLSLIKKYELHILEEKLLKYRIRGNGENISGPANNGRSYFEAVQIYRNMFDGVPIELFKEAFQDFIIKPDFTEGVQYELEKSFLFLKYDGQLPQIRTIGAERLFNLLEDPQILTVSKENYEFGIPQLYSLNKQIDVRGGEHYQELEKWSEDIEADRKKVIEQFKGLEQEYRLLEENYPKLEQEYRLLEQTHVELDNEFKELNKNYYRLQDFAQQLTKDRTVLKKRLAYSLKQNEEITAELNSTQVKLNELEQYLNVTRFTLSRFENDLRSLQATRTVRYSHGVNRIRKHILGSYNRKPFLGSIDLIKINRIGHLNVVGWVYGKHLEINKVLLKLNEVVIGTAEYGISRPDVRAAHHNKKMLYCGFKFSVQLDMSQIQPGTRILMVEIYDKKGNNYQLDQQPLLSQIIQGN